MLLTLTLSRGAIEHGKSSEQLDLFSYSREGWGLSGSKNRGSLGGTSTYSSDAFLGFARCPRGLIFRSAGALDQVRLSRFPGETASANRASELGAGSLGPGTVCSGLPMHESLPSGQVQEAFCCLSCHRPITLWWKNRGVTMSPWLPVRFCFKHRDGKYWLDPTNFPFTGRDGLFSLECFLRASNTFRL